MKRTLQSVSLLAALSVSSVALAQSTPSTPARPSVERHLASGLTEQDLEVPERKVASRQIAFETGLELLYTQSLDVENAKTALRSAALLELQARAAFAPTVSVTGRVALNDKETRLAGSNPLAPLVPYLDSVYDNDPALQALLASNPDMVDARDAAAIVPPPTVVSPRVDYRATATVTQPLYNGRFFPARRLADIAARQADASVETVMFRAQQAYTQLYFQAVALQRFGEIAEANVETARLSMERAKALFDARAGSEFDLTRAEVSYLTALSDYENSLIAYELAVEGIATMLRTEPNFDVVEPDELGAPSSLDAVLESAFTTRPEIVNAELDVEIQAARIAETRARFQPYVFAQAQATAARVTAFTGRAVTWNISLNASWDLWDGGAAKRDRRAAEISASQAEIRREQLIDTIRNEIRQAWLTMQTQGNLVRRAKSAADLAQMNYDLTMKAREFGAASALEIDVAQNQLFQAQLALADAEMQHRSSIYELYRLQGNAWSVRPDLQK